MLKTLIAVLSLGAIAVTAQGSVNLGGSYQYCLDSQVFQNLGTPQDAVGCHLDSRETWVCAACDLVQSGVGGEAVYANWQPGDCATMQWPTCPEGGTLEHCSRDRDQCEKQYAYEGNPSGFVACREFAYFYCGDSTVQAIDRKHRDSSVFGSLGIFFLAGITLMGFSFARVRP